MTMVKIMIMAMVAMTMSMVTKMMMQYMSLAIIVTVIATRQNFLQRIVIISLIETIIISVLHVLPITPAFWQESL